MMETLGVAIFLLEAAELGIVLWDKYRKNPDQQLPAPSKIKSK